MAVFSTLTQVNSHRRLTRRITLWLILAYVSFTVLAAIVIFSSVERSILAENRSLAGQTQGSIDSIYDQIQAISLQLMQDSTATAYLYERNSYFYGQSILKDLLGNYTKSHSHLVRYIGLYNGYLGTYETSIGTLPAGQMGLPVGNSQFSLRPREIKLEGSALDALNNEFARLVAFYARVDDNPQRTNHGLVIIHLDEAIFIDLLQHYTPGVNIYLTDASGIVFASNQPEAFITDLSFLPEFAGIFQNTSGTRQLDEQGILQTGTIFNRQLTYYQRSAESGLYEVLVIGNGVIWKRFLSLFIPLLMLGLVLLAAAILTIRRQMTSFYQPIRSLIHQVAGKNGTDGEDIKELDVQNEYAILHQALLLGDQASRIAREKYLYDLMTGSPNREDAERISQILVEFDAPAYLLIIARFDGFGILEELNAQDLGSFRFVIINITQELLNEVGPTTGIVTAENEVALMLQLQELTIPGTLEEVLSGAQLQIRRFFPLTVTFAYHNPVNQFSQFSAAYEQTLNLFSFRLFFGPNSILSQEKTLAINKNIRYPIMAEKRILEALNLRRQDMLLAGIDDFMQAIRAGYSQRIPNYFSQLLFSVFKQVDNTVDLVDDDYDNYTETNSRLVRCDQLEDARQIIARFCLELMTLSQEKTRNATDQKHERLHDDLVRYLQENLADPNLSLESTASRFNLSTGYLGKLVKASSGETFSSLLSTMRLERAAELLLTTSQPSYKVAEQVGIPNVTYFSTLFKRQYGLSPAPYREKNASV